MGVDRYHKHDDIGIIHQLNVTPGKQRGFIGATLLKAMFERAAYGCRLFCCWCAQDLEANRFWEAMGFVPLAYRAGSEKKARIHIYWQKRIRAGDKETPWWFPAKTDGGVIREDRIVLPIPPGKHWSDDLPVLLPAEDKPKLAGPKAMVDPTKGPLAPTPKPKARVQFGPPPSTPVVTEIKPEEKPAKVSSPKKKADPKLIAAARELRDRWLEHVNRGELLIESNEKYDVSRLIECKPPALLEAA
jgi:hypothetical protein